MICITDRISGILKRKFKMKKVVLLLAIGLLLLGSSAVMAQTTVVYTGQGFDGNGNLDSEKCGLATDLGQDKDFVVDPDGGYLKWVLTAAGATSATITGPWGTFDMIQVPNEQGVFHKATDFYPLEVLLAFPVSATYHGTVTGNVQLVVSNGCPGVFVPDPKVEVTKTAVTTYTRQHYWDIAKSVETEFGHELDELPKIWLYTDGSGNEKATWTVDVSYEGYLDKNFAVSGNIAVENTGNIPARVDSVDDYIETSQDIAATVVCPALPVTLQPGETLDCTYSSNLPDKTEGTNFANAAGVFLYPDDVVFDTFYKTGTAAITFGAPTTEINKTVNIEDISDLFGTKDLGSVTAPNDRTFTYYKVFTYAGFEGECGHFDYDNTATIVETEQSADATLLVNVQCLIFQDETAWAANGNEPLQLRYTNRGNWATYVAYAEKTTTLFAGQTIPVGSVSFSAVSGGNVTITVNLTGDWEFEDVAENLKVQDYVAAPSGNPSPGLFAHKKTCDVDESTCSIVVPANNFYGVHVNVGQWVPDPNFGP
jgi:hypothetical protein